MIKSQVKDFAEYLVYEIVDEKVHELCVCKEYEVAEVIARTLAYLDVQCDAYYITSVNDPGDFVPGGGWYDCWQKDKETNKLRRSSLS